MNEETRAPSTRASGLRARLWLVLRFILGLALVLGVLLLIVRALRPELQSLGTLFVERFGIGGVMLGTFLADGFHCPIPPQFYMLLAIAAGRSPFTIIAATSVASVLGGGAGCLVARRLGRLPRLARWLERSNRGVVAQLTQRHALRSALFASFTPIAFSMLCYLTGFYRLPRSAVLLLLALRVPKIALYYYLVSIGWHGL
jgi:membrane protein YqaA with SNARE-associated domain